MDHHPAAEADAARGLFDALPLPVCLVDANGRVIALNRSALSFWGIEPETVLGQPAMQALGIVPADGRGDAWGRLSPRGARPRLDCRITIRDGRVVPASLVHVSLVGAAWPAAALFVIHGVMTEALLPDWALRDPVTGLGNRHLWEREAVVWSSRSGCVVFFDLDDLKEVNDLHGHIAGDRLLAAAGNALQEIAPVDSLIVRYGGDEFVVVLRTPDEVAAESWAGEAVRHVAATSADLPIVPRLSHGVASFAPGTLRAAVRRADDVLYERKGVLLPASSGGGRIILTRDGRAALRRPGDDRAKSRPGTFASGFGAEFDAHFRAQFSRAIDQAREFVEFVDPRPGTAVVEVGAGAGRITFDGGLAQRIGSRGQLLVTDPSGAQLLAARVRAAEGGMDWIRFLQTPVEELPLASGTADMVVGALFLHFTEPTQAFREMARVIRPGGRVAICAFRMLDWPQVYLDVLDPVRRTLAALGQPLRTPFLEREELFGLVASAGLCLERASEVGPDAWECPSLDIALAGWRQLSLIPLLLKGIPDQQTASVQEEFEARLRAAFDRYPRGDWTLTGWSDFVVARKPG